MKNRLKRNKTWIVLGVALVMGSIAALGARGYLTTQMEAIEARGKGQTVNVLVAKRELKRGDKISTDTIAVRAVPLAYAQSSAISPEGFDRVDGQVLAYPVRSGEMILWGLMEGKRVPTFSARVEVGHRAMTVAVDEINSISGLLEPGDQIDLLVTVDRKGKKITRPLLQDVQVMATGQRAVDSPREGERHHYSTVTLDITPAQAQHVIMARDAGKVTALLRNPGDKHRIAGGNADMVALLADNAVKQTETGVPVLYGGSAKLTSENLVMGTPAAARTGSAPVKERTVGPEAGPSGIPVLSGGGPARAGEGMR